MRCIVIIVLSLLLLARCESDKIKKETIEGVPVIHNPYDGLWQHTKDKGFTFRLKQTYGALNEPVSEIFGRITEVLTDKYLNVYIFDQQENRLVKFDSTGKLLWLRKISALMFHGESV